MDSVSFLQQQIRELGLQISQLMTRRRELEAEITIPRVMAMLDKYNLNKPDESGTMVIPAGEK